MNLITTFYISDNQERQKEINRCIINNIKNEYIKKIYLLNDKIYNLDFITNSKKIEQIIVDDDSKKRLNFKYAFDFCNQKLKNEICIIANSDIYFDKTLKQINKIDFNNKLIALSRYDNNVLFNNSFSQDTWIFKSPTTFDTIELNFNFGILGCDNILAYTFYKNGYIVSNPSKTIKTHHLHNSKHRTYNNSDRIWGLYYLVTPIRICEEPKGKLIDYQKDGMYEVSLKK